MKYFIAIILLYLPVSLSYRHFTETKTVAAKLKIAIIDTGYNEALVSGDKLKLCDSGHFDYKYREPKIGSSIPHGTLVSAEIAKELVEVDYCAIIFQVHDGIGNFSPRTVADAVRRAIDLDVVAINLSMSGNIFSKEEYNAFNYASSKGVRIFVAAGNDRLDFDQECAIFPACYSSASVYPVGALTPFSTRALYSNYGSRVNLWYLGHCQTGALFMEGTSCAAPRALSDYVRLLSTHSRVAQMSTKKLSEK